MQRGGKFPGNSQEISGNFFVVVVVVVLHLSSGILKMFIFVVGNLNLISKKISSFENQEPIRGATGTRNILTVNKNQ